jgi:serine/threonine protein kinase
MNISSNSNIQQLQKQLTTATQELTSARSTRAIAGATVKIQSIQTQINEILSKFDAQVGNMKMNSKVAMFQASEMAVWIPTALNIQKEASRVLDFHNQVTSRIADAESKNELSQLKNHVKGPEREIISSYQRMLERAQPPLSAAERQAVLKVIISAVNTHLVGHKEVTETVGNQPVKLLALREEGRSVKVLKFLGSGADARVYGLGSRVLKVSNKDKESELQADAKVHALLNHKIRVITSPEGSAVEMERFKGDYSEQRVLRGFLRSLGIAERELRGISQAEKEKLIDRKYAKLTPGFKMKIEDKLRIHPDILVAKLKADFVPLDKKMRQDLCDQMLKQYQTLWKKDIVHNDIKPENTMWKQDEKTGKLRFQIADYGRAVWIQDRYPGLKLVSENFVFPNQSGLNRFREMVSYIRQDVPDKTVKPLSDVIKLYASAGLLNKLPDGRFEPNDARIRKFLAEATDPQKNAEWINAGLIYKDNNGSAKLTFCLNAKDYAVLQSMLRVLSNPLSTEVTPSYLDDRSTEWAIEFARMGNVEGVIAATDSSQQTTLGHTIFEMLTGTKLPREESSSYLKPLTKEELGKVRQKLMDLRLKPATVDQLCRMMTPQPPSPSEIQQQIKKDFFGKEDPENHQGRFAAAMRDYYLNPDLIPADYAEIAARHGFDRNHLLFKPKTMVEL